MKKIIITACLFISIGVQAQDTVNVQQEITNAYDSYNLLVELKAKQQPLSESDSSAYERNKGHLSIMLAKGYFFEALTTEQKSQLQLITQ